jgi:hypothetical protein
MKALHSFDDTTVMGALDDDGVRGKVVRDTARTVAISVIF